MYTVFFKYSTNMFQYATQIMFGFLVFLSKSFF